MSCLDCQTLGEQFKSALSCEMPEQAEAWMKKEVKHLVDHHEKTPIVAVKHIKSNLGYMAGYYDDATARKIHRLFGAVHPIFGTSTYYKDMNLEEAIEIGKQLGRNRR